MAGAVDRGSSEGRLKRDPDLFLSHSSQDKKFVERLTTDLCALGVDTFLDTWELEVGHSLQRVLGDALERSKYVGLVLSEHFVASRWAGDEMAQAMSRERRLGGNVVLPLLIGTAKIPPLLEDRVYLDFRSSYFSPLVRLAGAVHGVRKQRIELALASEPQDLLSAVDALRSTGFEPYLVVDRSEFNEILRAGGRVDGDEVRFDPRRVADNPLLSPVTANYLRLWLKHRGALYARSRKFSAIHNEDQFPAPPGFQYY